VQAKQKKELKAQVSAEFLVIYSVLLTISVIGFVIYYGGSLNYFQTSDILSATKDSHSIAAAINYVYLAGDGAEYSFKFTQKSNYTNITIFEYSVNSERPHASSSAAILNGDVDQDGTIDSTVIIRNSHGSIIIEPG